MTRNFLIEFDEFITPDGLIYDFHNGDDKTLLSFTGRGMPSITYLTQEQVHGKKITGYRLNERSLTYVHRRNACSRQGYWDNRRTLIDFLRPNRQGFPTANFGYNQGTLRTTLPNGDMMAIDVVIQQGPIFRERSLTGWDEFSYQESLVFTASDPTFYDPIINNVSFTIESFDNLIFGGNQYFDPRPRITFNRFPPFNDINAPGLIFGTTVINAVQNINYTGTWLSYPTITITGPMNKAVITNNTTNERIAFKTDISAGQIVTITLDQGNKTVTDNLGNNLIGVLTTDSDLATFHIAPDPEATDGINTISVFASGGVLGQTAIDLDYYTRFIGI